MAPERPRPLSPHLTIYRWPVSMATSITHRITGIALSVGTVLLAAWLVAVSNGPEALQGFMTLAVSPLGLVVLFGFTWVLFHHLLGGLRHFVWDLGYGFSHEELFGLAWVNLIASILLTLIVWAVFVWF